MAQKLGEAGDAAALARAFERMGGAPLGQASPGRRGEAEVRREAPVLRTEATAADESDDEDRTCALLDALELVDGWEVPPMPPLPAPGLGGAGGAPAGVRGLGVAGVAAASRAQRESEPLFA